VLGTVVISGMLAATALAIFVIPVLFVLIERLATRRGAVPALTSQHSTSEGGA
jgi:Cu/Ag efflux pump CusA